MSNEEFKSELKKELKATYDFLFAMIEQDVINKSTGFDYSFENEKFGIKFDIEIKQNGEQ